MITTFRLPKIYPLTDVVISGLSHAEQVARCAKWGAPLVQLREKKLGAYDFYSQASTALRVARENQIRLIINDRVDVAMSIGADGVHLGQEDLPPEAARKLLGNDALIGYSTHSVEQASQAVSLPLNYLAIGPIFPTSTKENPDPTIGLEGLRAVRSVVGTLPLVAIGGISLTDVPAVLEAGADSAALLSAIWKNSEETLTQLHSLVSQL